MQKLKNTWRCCNYHHTRDLPNVISQIGVSFNGFGEKQLLIPSSSIFRLSLSFKKESDWDYRIFRHRILMKWDALVRVLFESRLKV